MHSRRKVQQIIYSDPLRLEYHPLNFSVSITDGDRWSIAGPDWEEDGMARYRVSRNQRALMCGWFREQVIRVKRYLNRERWCWFAERFNNYAGVCNHPQDV